jgi:hypothetical protein
MKMTSALRSLAIFATLLLVNAGPLHSQTGVRFLDITIPVHNAFNPCFVPPVFTYEWQTATGSADPDQVRFALVSTQPFGGYIQTVFYLRQTPNAPEWSSWMPYLPPVGGTSWTTPSTPIGDYIFAVQGKSSDGVSEDLDELRNVMRIKVGNRDTGPLLTVTGDLIAPIVTIVTTTPVTDVNVAAGTPVTFCWTADASAYCGLVSGYRYGWDILDPDDDEQWEIDFTPLPPGGACSPPLSFHFGTHVFQIEVIDNSGYKSRVPIKLHILPPTSTKQTTWGKMKALYGGNASQP